MIEKILSMWKRATCRHEVDKLRFVRMIHGDDIYQLNVTGMFEYHCAGCGKKVYKVLPVRCEGCKYFHMWGNGKTVCERSRELEVRCLRGAYRCWWSDKE